MPVCVLCFLFRVLFDHVLRGCRCAGVGVGVGLGSVCFAALSVCRHSEAPRLSVGHGAPVWPRVGPGLWLLVHIQISSSCYYPGAYAL